MVKKIAYLTIDDAPSKDFQHKVDFLLSENIPAIFFCEGRKLESYANAVIYAIRNKFLIANHGYDHFHFSELSLDACMDQIRVTDKIIQTLYDAAGVAWHEKYFRFPYGDKGGLNNEDVFSTYHGEGVKRKQAIQSFLTELGYSQPSFEGITYQYYRAAGLLDDVDWHWTYDVREWGVAFGDPDYGVDSLEAVYARMDEDEPEGCRGLNFWGSDEIVLMHDHVETTHIFEPIIERLLAKGLKFKLPRTNE